MTIHFFTFGDRQKGTSRQRAFRVAEEMHKRGIDTVIHTPPVLSLSTTPWPAKGGLILQVLRSLKTIQKDDVVYLQRTIANKYFVAIIVAYLFFTRRKMAFDFDDPVYLHSFGKTKILTKMADAVIVCTHAQAAWAKQFNKNVHIVHIAVDYAAFARFSKQHQAVEAPRIGWLGTAPEHLRNLELLVPVFTRLVEQGVRFTFVLIGSLKNERVYALFKAIPNLDVSFVDTLDWSDPSAVPKELQTLDVGLQPHMNDGEWNKGKTSLKMLEYMATGLPVISSSFGEIPHIIHDGENGCIAENEDEWVEKLKELIADVDLRSRLGSAGQRTAKDEYSFDAIVPRIIEILSPFTGKSSR